MRTLLVVGVMLTLILMNQSVIANKCTNAFPGAEQMIMGVDITNLDLLPLHGVNDQSRRGAVLDLTCNADNTVSNYGKVYQQPDQVSNPELRLGNFSSTSVNIIRTIKDLKQSISNNVSVDFRYLPVSFEDSISYKKMQNILSSDTKQIIEVTSYESAYRIEKNDLARLSSEVKLYIEKSLSTVDFATNKEPYLEFIKRYGTHYLSQGSFGAVIKDHMIIQSTYSDSKTDEEIKSDSNAAYFKLIDSISSTISFPEDKTSVSEAFKDKTQSSVIYYGGDRSLAEDNQLDQWRASVHADPWLFACKLEPIYYFVTDETVRNNLKKATEYYVLQQTRSNLLDMLKAFEKIPIPLFHTLQENVRAMTLDKSSDLKEKIQYHTKIPSWFHQNTNLCYVTKKTASSHGSEHCSPSNSGTDCALPDNRLQAHYDDTGPIYNGCHMQWTIKSKQPSDWFKKVQICYKYYSTGNENCNGNLHAEYCAPVNQLTHDYIDTTSSVEGYCKMSWKLTAPEDAPLWMKTMRLCFMYGIDTNANSCGDIDTTTICTVSGTYLPFYKDNTEGKSVEGCFLSWAWYTAYHTGVTGKYIYTTVDDLKKRLSKFESIPTADLHRLQKKISNVSKFADVTSLVDEFDYHTNIPDWFAYETNLCFTHLPTDPTLDAHHCSSGKIGQECVRPDKKMLAHWEQTGANKQCHMQWTIKSGNSPAWFQKTQLCFKYESTGDEKCNGDSKNVTCATVNNLTQDYIDSTSTVNGYCRMSWKLTTSEDAPMWMKTVRFCFYWGPDDENDKDTCGDLEQRSYCVIPGNWTPFYKDNSDERKGKGCYMSWGWFTIYH